MFYPRIPQNFDIFLKNYPKIYYYFFSGMVFTRDSPRNLTKYSFGKFIRKFHQEFHKKLFWELFQKLIHNSKTSLLTSLENLQKYLSEIHPNNHSEILLSFFFCKSYKNCFKSSFLDFYGFFFFYSPEKSSRNSLTDPFKNSSKYSFGSFFQIMLLNFS